MQVGTKANTGKTKLFIIGSMLIIALGSMGWYAKSNWYTTTVSPTICSLNQTAIYDNYKFTVPIIFTEYVYDVSIKGSKPVSFTLNADGNWTLYDAYKKPIIISGTGFFVSKAGELMTNKHVVEPWNYNEEAASLSNALAYFVKSTIESAEIRLFLLNNWENRFQKNENDSEDVIEELTTEAYTQVLETSNDSSNNKEESVSDLVTQVAIHNEGVTPVEDIAYINQTDIKITPNRVRVYIVMHGSELTASSIIPCKVVRSSSDQSIDIALIQTKEEYLPKQVKNIIDLDSASIADQNIKPGTKAYMLGYPMGTTLASTKKGIRVQIYEGQVNKEADGMSLQYNITSTHGASGSPVINDCGQLIAVNYTEFDIARGFNFGIVAKYARDLFKGK